MIYIDNDEQGSINIPSAIPVPWLERQTGADAIVTFDLPLTEELLQSHLNMGAILVQIKRHGDLISSIGTRLNHSIATMNQFNIKYWQKVLLTVGHYRECPKTGKVLVGKERPQKNKVFISWYKSRPPKDFRSYTSAIRRWGLRGGLVVSSCKTIKHQNDWLLSTQDDLQNLSERTTKQVFPDSPKFYEVKENDPLQEPRIINDFRVTLATLPGIGHKMADLVWDHYNHNPTACLIGLTDPVIKSHPIRGIGAKTITNIRNYLRIEHGMLIGFNVIGDE